jgi:pSer/pThr/pTyr-binding forkhead associated (FHA) protein
VPESLLTILKFLLVALLYLFFFRVLRAVWAEVQATRAAPTARAAPRAAPRPSRDRAAVSRLKIVEPSAQRGRAFQLGAEMTVGRAPGCGVRIEDTYASQLHARIFQRDGQYHVEDLGSTNGTYINRKGTRSRDKVSGPMVVRNGDRIIIGQTVLEVVR